MWVVGNYHWYLKQEFVLNMDEQLTSKPVLEWDTVEPYLLHGYHPGEFTILSLSTSILHRTTLIVEGDTFFHAFYCMMLYNYKNNFHFNFTANYQVIQEGLANFRNFRDSQDLGYSRIYIGGWNNWEESKIRPIPTSVIFICLVCN